MFDNDINPSLKKKGTYLAFLSLWQTLGINWSRTFVLYLIEFLTFRNCVFVNNNHQHSLNSTNSSTINPNFNSTISINRINLNDCSSDTLKKV